MNSKTRNCQNCHQDFRIEPDDFLFYERIKVPPPTFCPECRMVRRMVFRNLKTLYKRKVFGNEKAVFSGYAPDSPFTIYDQKTWWSGDYIQSGQKAEYDFSKPFFSQLQALMRRMPWPASYSLLSINSDYCNNVYSLRDCYLIFNSGFSEDCHYGTDIMKGKSCVEVSQIMNCTLSYELFDCEKCYRAFFSSHCKGCTDIYFSSNLVDCHNCFGCVNLKHKQYYIFNEAHSKDEYFKRLNEFKLGSFKSILDLREQQKAHQLKFPHKFMHGIQNSNVVGDYVSYSKNCFDVFYSRELEDCSYCQLIYFGKGSNSYDMSTAAGELCYEVEEAGGYQLKFVWMGGSSKLTMTSTGLQYSMNCFDSSNLFGCVGLRNKKYCILNKQYVKEEYEKMVSKVIQHMNDMPYVDKKGRIYKYGEFFPSDLSPFAYNETIAQEYFPLTREEAIAQGYAWRESERNYQVNIKSENLPDHIEAVKDGIVNKVIDCAHGGKCDEQCATAFKIVKRELELYRTFGSPLSRLCPNCRHYQRLRDRNPLKLWHRTCTCGGTQSENGIYKNQAIHFHNSSRCPNEFETSYAPDRPEIVYCEQCYQQEVI